MDARRADQQIFEACVRPVRLLFLATRMRAAGAADSALSGCSEGSAAAAASVAGWGALSRAVALAGELVSGVEIRGRRGSGFPGTCQPGGRSRWQRPPRRPCDTHPCTAGNVPVAHFVKQWPEQRKCPHAATVALFRHTTAPNNAVSAPALWHSLSPPWSAVTAIPPML